VSAGARFSGDPPGPRGLRATARAIAESRRDTIGFFRGLVREYGDIVYVPAFGLRLYVVGHPDDIGHVLVRNARNYVKDRLMRRGRPVFGNGLLLSEGDFWR